MHPIFPIWLIILFVLAAAAVMLVEYRRTRFQARQLIPFFLLESILLISLLALLLQPVWKKKRPRPGAYRIVLLGDCSRSMSINDMERGKSRRQALADVKIKPADARTEYIAFAGEMRSVQSFAGAAYMPGMTATGSHLKQLLDEAERRMPLGAVLLCSDGMANEGEELLAAAKEYRRRGIPISCLGLGGVCEARDMAVSWKQPSLAVPRDTEALLTAVITGNFSSQVKLSFSESGNTISEQLLSFEGKPLLVQFPVKARTEGFHSYRVSIESGSQEIRQDNNQAYCSLEVTRPPVIRILSLLAGLDWEQRFIQQLAMEDGRLSVASIVMLNEEHFFVRGIHDCSKLPKNSFPQASAFYDDFDVVMLDTRAAPYLKKEGIEALCSFVEYKGGGLLLRGTVDELPQPLAEMVPAQLSNTATLLYPERLQPLFDTAFANERTGLLKQGILLKQGARLLSFEKLRTSARNLALLNLKNGSMPVAVSMPYGAGRLVQTGVENSWRWSLAGNEQYRAWWIAQLQWLAEAAKPRVRELSSRNVTTSNEALIELSVLDDAFQPAADARISAIVSHPDGRETTLQFEAMPDEEGRYSAHFVPEADGEYRLFYQVRLPGRELSHDSILVASSVGLEMQETSFNESLLRDVARMTGGEYIFADEIDLVNIPISGKVPWLEEERALASSWLLFFIFATSAMLLCLLRRRFGLK